jgi:hypothetical protein
MVRRCHAEVDIVLRNNAATKEKLGILLYQLRADFGPA